jgi:glutathione peroxidase
MESLHDHAARLPDGRTVPLDRYAGQVLLVVNVASRCGFTPQYEGLQSLHERFAPQGFSVLGFPCNQFGGQEPGDDAAIGAFCQTRYHVTFPLFAKGDVNGPDAPPLWQFLTRRAPGLFGSRRIKWNFTKFLVNRAGQPVRRFAPSTRPERLAGAIGTLLGE